MACVRSRLRRLSGPVARFAAGRGAAVAVMAAILLPVLVGGIALAVESGYWRLSQRKMQQAADLAAYAGAGQLRSAADAAAMAAAAEAAADESGARAGEDAFVFNQPPAAGAFAGRDNAVEVELRRSQRRFFTLIYSSEDVAISARAVAEVRGGGDACVLALHPTSSAAISVSGSSSVGFDGCAVASNSNADDGVSLNGGGALQADCVQSVGGVSGEANLTLGECAGPRIEAPVVVDPYADLAIPPPSGPCESGDIGKNNQDTTVTPTQTSALGLPTMRFCGGLRPRGDVTFSSGVYFVDGGDFRVNANVGVFGAGVAFVLSNGAEIRFNGGADLNLTAPSLGPLAGMLIVGERAATGASHTINGDATSALNGVIYTPSSDLNYNGSFSGSDGCLQIVANRVAFGGGAAVSADCAPNDARRIAVGEIVALIE